MLLGLGAKVSFVVGNKSTKEMLYTELVFTCQGGDLKAREV